MKISDSMVDMLLRLHKKEIDQISLMMARISTDNRGRVIGLLQACLSQREEAQRFHCQQSYVARLCEKYQRTGKSMFRCKILS